MVFIEKYNSVAIVFFQIKTFFHNSCLESNSSIQYYRYLCQLVQLIIHYSRLIDNRSNMIIDYGDCILSPIKL